MGCESIESLETCYNNEAKLTTTITTLLPDLRFWDWTVWLEELVKSARANVVRWGSGLVAVGCWATWHLGEGRCSSWWVGYIAREWGRPIQSPMQRSACTSKRWLPTPASMLMNVTLRLSIRGWARCCFHRRINLLRWSCVTRTHGSLNDIDQREARNIAHPARLRGGSFIIFYNTYYRWYVILAICENHRNTILANEAT